MFAEFALTPSIFDDAAHPDADAWREQLRELGGNMFPKMSGWPTFIANLYDGSWHTVALQMAEGIKDQRARFLCEGLLANAAKTLVTRPARLDWPEDELAWGREAIRANSDEPIERLIATSASHTVLAAEHQHVRHIQEVMDSGFWRGISSDASPEMSIQSQIALLRKICVHADFLCLLTGYIYGGGDDEADFAIDFIRSAFRRPSGFRVPEIEIHTEAPNGDPTDPGYSDKLAKSIGSIRSALQAALAPGQHITLFLWPKVRERLLIAGINANVGATTQQRSPRWGVSMSHVARRGDAARAAQPTEWKVLKRDSLGDWFDRYCKAGRTGMVGTPVRIFR